MLVSIQKLEKLKIKYQMLRDLLMLVLKQKLENLKIKYQLLLDQLLMLIFIQKSEKLKNTATEFNKFSGEIFNAKIETNADLSNAEDRAIKNKK